MWDEMKKFREKYCWGCLWIMDSVYIVKGILMGVFRMLERKIEIRAGMNSIGSGRYGVDVNVYWLYKIRVVLFCEIYDVEGKYFWL